VKIRGNNSVLAAATAFLVASSCGDPDPEPVGEVQGVVETVSPTENPMCSAYLQEGVESGFAIADLTALDQAFSVSAPPAVLVALETLQGFATTPTDPSVGEEFTIDEAWGTIGGYVKPLCRASWRDGVTGSSSPLDTATAFSRALGAGDRAQLRSLGAANVVAAFTSALGGQVDLGAVTHSGFDIVVGDRAAECVFHEGFVDDCAWVS
jgi:hypothetical protein